MKVLAKILAINPLLSLFITIAYVAGLWWIVSTIWHNGHQVLAVVIMVLTSAMMKYKSKALIDNIIAIKKDRSGIDT